MRSLILASALTLGVQAQPFQSTSRTPSHTQGDIYVSPKVNIQEVCFKNQYGLDTGAQLCTPKSMQKGKKYPAWIVGHPMGVLKKQVSQIYATKLIKRGFVAPSFDLNFWGQCAGTPRHAVLPDTHVEGFGATIDGRDTRNFINREKIVVVGVCTSGDFALAAAKINPCMKAITMVGMYAMDDTTRHGVRDSINKVQREAFLKETANERY
ncbi:alpha/beta hydrolase [Helicobacter gastrocanis]|uniref:alpha/beta hydrolase n=1 Tax=Helicobacter gastrocanis TaxID=2849641 RepID=UPI001C84F284|nr:alpha/beta hydrolase [Helicobacter sp. NHP19-003]